MAEDEEYLSIPGYVPVKVAAKMLELSQDRITQHIHSGRLPSKKVGGRYLIPAQAVEEFRRNPPGRTRKQPARWRIYDDRVKLLSMLIQVRVRAGQRENLEQKLEKIYEEQQLRFEGSLARYILSNSASPDIVTIILHWKSNEMPDEARRKRDLEAFQQEFADVLDWESAQISEHEGLLYT
ncbi:helix-turn-helix domain-containing protein [Ktedonosporobacter rubrisoli]|uniref:Helix-turn-helix domain-containing protein n=1 Tax=Ktedonosporobacter rubrisoli TaxID=2509675 RepID=A0A4P6K5H9_KTERU|nr:helix-turn-helix domain-containing protein [Ktedonosporobacter rubrisoli]QBD83627.1 helix-turn-helix domain-containing protein [Ktedonosporobacter rubrisoli]